MEIQQFILTILTFGFSEIESLPCQWIGELITFPVDHITMYIMNSGNC